MRNNITEPRFQLAILRYTSLRQPIRMRDVIQLCDSTQNTSTTAYIPHRELYLCCFLSVSCHKRSCSKLCFGFSTTKKTTRENSPVLRCPKKSLRKFPHTTPIAPKLRLSIDRRFSFLENVVPNIESWPQEDEECR